MNDILTIEQTYRQASSRIDNIPELANALKLWHQTHPEHNYLHPCVIDGRAALVCEHDLSNKDGGQAFAELRAIAGRHGVFLKEDGRTRDAGSVPNNRRQNLGIVLTFCFGLMASSRLVTADELSSGMAHFSMPVSSMQLKMEVGQDGERTLSIRHASLPTAEEVLAAYAKKSSAMLVDTQAEEKIKQFLLANYRPDAGDPGYVAADLADIAQYYAKYPQVIDLLNELHPKKLMLKYKADNWQAQAWGTQTEVDGVIIYFDTRVAARLLERPDCHANPACDISPADALLHELLHAKLMLVDSRHFVERGGMRQSLYNYEHEREVIASENQLYDEMNQQDGLSRPLRQQHTGILFHVNCAACRPDEIITAN